jgi:hypothetical protein
LNTYGIDENYNSKYGFFGAGYVMTSSESGYYSYVSPNAYNLYEESNPKWANGLVHPIRTFSLKKGEIISFNTNNFLFRGKIYKGFEAGNITIELDYSGGNGGTVKGEFTSTGVTGLTATLNQTLTLGSGILKLMISGTPSSVGDAIFNIQLSGITKILKIPVIQRP